MLLASLSCCNVQVFWHILTKLAYYRELTLRIDQLAAKGMLDPAALAAAASSGVVPDVEELLDKSLGKGASGGGDHPTGAGAAGSADGAAHGQPGMPMNEVDTFGAKLNSILAADLTAVALAQGSLDTIPLGPLATLMPLLQMAGQLNDPTIKSALKQVSCCTFCPCKRVVLLFCICTHEAEANIQAY